MWQCQFPDIFPLACHALSAILNCCALLHTSWLSHTSLRGKHQNVVVLTALNLEMSQKCWPHVPRCTLWLHSPRAKHNPSSMEPTLPARYRITLPLDWCAVPTGICWIMWSFAGCAFATPHACCAMPRLAMEWSVHCMKCGQKKKSRRIEFWAWKRSLRSYG